jgi:hypothetical protein
MYMFRVLFAPETCRAYNVVKNNKECKLHPIGLESNIYSIVRFVFLKDPTLYVSKASAGIFKTCQSFFFFHSFFPIYQVKIWAL